MSPTAAFTLAGGHGAPVDGDVLGVWRQQSFVGHGAASSTTGAPVWRVDLGADVSVGQSQLGAGWSRLDEATRALPAAAQRLDRVLSEWAAPAYDARDPTEVPSPEEELRLSLEAPNGPSEMPAFSSWAPQSPSWWRPQVEELARFAERVRSWCSPTAWVETEAGGGRLARSRLTFGGDVATVWHRHRDDTRGALHAETVKLVIATRTTLLRAVALATQGALSVAVRLSNPATAVLAIPATWRFVQSVANEIRQAR